MHHLGDGEQSFVAKAVITIFRLTPAAELDAYFEGIIPKDERDIRVRDAEEIRFMNAFFFSPEKRRSARPVLS